MPLPSEDEWFHAPARLPEEITRPRGFPSGVKKPALMAARAFLALQTAAEEGQIDAVPFGWSATMRRWVRASKATPLKRILLRVVCEREGGAGGVGSGWLMVGRGFSSGRVAVEVSVDEAGSVRVRVCGDGVGVVEAHADSKVMGTRGITMLRKFMEECLGGKLRRHKSGE